MKKIISLFKRDYEKTHLVYNEVVPGAEWVVNGEGVATRKFDGTPVMIHDSGDGGYLYYKRLDVKVGKQAPENAIACQENPDAETGHWPHWVPIQQNDRADRWLLVAILNYKDSLAGHAESGTYEAIGPHFQRNAENFEVDTLVRHGVEVLSNVPRDFEGLKKYFETMNPLIEGIVWHHPDGRMVKIKAKDFGFKR